MAFGGKFQCKQGRHAGVFVTAVTARHISDRFFGRENKLVGPVGVNRSCNVFEPDQQIADNFDSVRAADRD